MSGLLCKLWSHRGDVLGTLERYTQQRGESVTKSLTASDDRHLFVVRVWREESELPPGSQWRGSVEHVPSGQRVYFASLETLTGFIDQYLTTDSHRREGV